MAIPVATPSAYWVLTTGCRVSAAMIPMTMLLSSTSRNAACRVNPSSAPSDPPSTWCRVAGSSESAGREMRSIAGGPLVLGIARPLCDRRRCEVSPDVTHTFGQGDLGLEPTAAGTSDVDDHSRHLSGHGRHVLGRDRPGRRLPSDPGDLVDRVGAATADDH